MASLPETIKYEGRAFCPDASPDQDSPFVELPEAEYVVVDWTADERGSGTIVKYDDPVSGVEQEVVIDDLDFDAYRGEAV